MARAGSGIAQQHWEGATRQGTTGEAGRGGDGRGLRREQVGVEGSACHRRCPGAAAPSTGAAQGWQLLAQATLA
jgi:hypothetical protein